MTMQSCATCLGEEVQTVCGSGRDTSTVLRGQRILQNLLFLRTGTVMATLQDHMTFLKAFLFSMTMTTTFSSHLCVSPSHDNRNTSHNQWILMPVGISIIRLQGHSEVKFFISNTTSDLLVDCSK